MEDNIQNTFYLKAHVLICVMNLNESLAGLDELSL